MSLRTRIAALTALVVVAVITVVGVAVDRAAERELVEEIDLELLQRARTLVSSDRPAPQIDDVSEALSGQERQRSRRQRGEVLERLGVDGTYARVLRPSGEVVANLREFRADVDPAVLAAADDGPVLSDGRIGEDRARVVTVKFPSGFYVQVARPLSEIDRSLADLGNRIMRIGLVAAAAAAAVAWLLADRAARPIVRLTQATDRVAATGDLDTVVDGSGGDEVGRLAASFNDMLAALAASKQQQHRLVMDASHELRTPLTSLRTNIDVLRTAPDLPGPDRASIIADIDAEVDELTALMTELVDLASDVREDEPRQPVALPDLVRGVVERAERRTGRSIEVVVEKLAVAEVRPHALARAVRNLLDNAAKFSPSESAIRIVIDGGRVVVHDAGIGIPESERERIFDRFHRAEVTRSSPGSGLGLAIVRHVVHGHGGTVWATDSPDGGAAVGLQVPTVDD